MDERQFMEPTYGALVERVSVLEGQLEVKAALLVGMAVELADSRHRLEQMTASYEVLKAQYEDAMSMALEPEEGLTWVERKVLRAVPSPVAGGPGTPAGP